MCKLRDDTMSQAGELPKEMMMEQDKDQSGAAVRSEAASEPTDQLYGAVMNIPCKTTYLDAVVKMAYKEGHRDARHAAADLVAAFPSSPSAADALAPAKIPTLRDLAMLFQASVFSNTAVLVHPESARHLLEAMTTPPVEESASHTSIGDDAQFRILTPAWREAAPHAEGAKAWASLVDHVDSILQARENASRSATLQEARRACTSQADGTSGPYRDGCIACAAGLDDLRLHTEGDSRAPAAQAASVAGWQPIETAPRTGRTVLLGCFNSMGNWRTMRGQWFTKAEIDQDWEETDGFEAGWYETAEEPDVPNCWAINPTHWASTPPAPQQEVSEAVI